MTRNSKGGSGASKATVKSAEVKTHHPQGAGDEKSPRPYPILQYFIITVLSLVAGLLTPPFVAWYNEVQRDATVSNSKFYAQSTVDTIENSDTDIDNKDDDAIIPTPCTDENLSNFLHDKPVLGMHILCFSVDDNDSASLNVYHGAHDSAQTKHLVDLPVDYSSWDKLKEVIVKEFNLTRKQQFRQPWALFDSHGERIIGANDHDFDGKFLFEEGMIILTAGGNWLWPGVREGFKRTIELYSIMPDSPGSHEQKSTPRNITLETLSLEPLVLSVENFIAQDECDHIQQRAAPDLRYSGVSLMDKDKGKAASEWRTSQSTFLNARNDPILLDLEWRTASLTRVSRQHQEETQVLRYGKTEKYSAHHDFFNPSLYRNDPGTLRLIENGRKNRLATVFWYLSDVPAGGHTIFPRHGGRPQPFNFDDCSKGLKVKPEKGKVIIFYSLLANGQGDDLSLHGACPVEEGIKWAANKWVWNAPMSYI